MVAHVNPIPPLQAIAGALPLAVVECCYTENSLTDAAFFSLPTTLGPNGAEEPLCYLKYHNATSLTAFEKANYAWGLPPTASATSATSLRQTCRCSMG